MDLVGNYYILLRGRLRAVYDLENQEMAVDGPPSIFYLIKSKLILCFFSGHPIYDHHWTVNERLMVH